MKLKQLLAWWFCPDLHLHLRQRYMTRDVRIPLIVGTYKIRGKEYPLQGRRHVRWYKRIHWR